MAWIILLSDQKTIGVLGAIGPTTDDRLAMLFEDRLDAEAMVERYWYERRRFPAWTPTIQEVTDPISGVTQARLQCGRG